MKDWKSFAFSKPKAPKYIQASPISSEQSLFWAYAAFSHGHTLTQDAKLLCEAGRISTGVGLYMIAVEEFGKVGIIFDYMIAGAGEWPKSQGIWDKARKDLLSHPKKIESAFSFMFRLLNKAGSKYENIVLRKLASVSVNPFQAFQMARELALYTTAWNRIVLTPNQMEKMFGKLVPSGFLLIEDIYVGYMETLNNAMPRLMCLMNNLYENKREASYEVKFQAYKKEVKKLFYFTALVKYFFNDYAFSTAELLKTAKLQLAVDVATHSRTKRKVRLLLKEVRGIKEVKDTERIALLLRKNI